MASLLNPCRAPVLSIEQLQQTPLSSEISQQCLLQLLIRLWSSAGTFSVGVIALDLAKELLELHPNKIAMVVSHENITNNYYTGKDRGML